MCILCVFYPLSTSSIWSKLIKPTRQTHTNPIMTISYVMTRSRTCCSFFVAVERGMARPNPEESVAKSTVKRDREGGRQFRSRRRKMKKKPLLLLLSQLPVLESELMPNDKVQQIHIIGCRHRSLKVASNFVHTSSCPARKTISDSTYT